MQRKLKILYVSAEIAPFARRGSLADVAGSLPKVLKDIGHDIRLFIPKYSTINDRKYTIREVIRLKEIKVPLHNKTVFANVKSAFLPNSKVQVYFVENKDYFDRPDPFIDPETNQAYSDDADRFIFFCNSIFAILRKLHWQPDIIHCNDWHTALIPFLFKTIYFDDPFFNKIKTVLTIHDLSSQGIFDEAITSLIGDPQELFYPDSAIEYEGKVNLLKAGLIYADFINTTSKSYARDIRTSNQASFGLKRVLKERPLDLNGITNGVDYSIWNPETDTLIPKTYSRKDFQGKVENKKKLVESHGLTFKTDMPVIGIMVNLFDETSLDMFREIIDRIMNLDAQFIMVGNINEKYQKVIQSSVKKYPGKIAINFKSDDQLDHLMVAGCDMFLIPCKLEPCGSVNLYCLKYGTIPIVHATGGLLDTVKEFNSETKKGFGFVFRKYTPESLLTAAKQAIQIFNDTITWRKLVDRAMRLNFSWEVVAEKYDKLYNSLME
jgi:starch synthase